MTTQSILPLKRVPWCKLVVPASPKSLSHGLSAVGEASRNVGLHAVNRDSHTSDRGSVVASAVAEEAQLGGGDAALDAPPVFHLACPICQLTEFPLAEAPLGKGHLECPRCKRSFEYNDVYVDLTLSSGVGQQVYKEQSHLGTSTFQNPLVSLVYERGWRQSFAQAGFPGEAKEFEFAMEYLEPVAGEVLMDLSCGSGLFTRRFAASKRFPGILAVDFSESMLKQTQRYLQRNHAAVGATPIVGVRADVSRMPFTSGSVAGVHAGAAIHCWPNPTAAMAEISRVLKPGGVLVASTFMKYTAPLGEIFGDNTVRPLSRFLEGNGRTSSTIRAWEEQELRDLANLVGLVDFKCRRISRFIMFSARKPNNHE